MFEGSGLTGKALFVMTLCYATFLGWQMCPADDGFYVVPVVKPAPVAFPAPVPGTYQIGCVGENGTYRECSGTGEDYEYEAGVIWPYPRFELAPGGGYRNRLTGLIWQTNANNGPLKW